MRSNLLSTSAICSAALLSAASFSAPAAAQDAASAPVTDQAAADTDEDAIVITGSRIARPEFAAPNPIVTVSTETIEQSGETNLTTILQGIPALTGSLDSGQTSGTAAAIGFTGAQLLNLRNLGYERTLVLVDGRRHIGQIPETAAVDVGTIPVDLIERVEVLTGGTGAVYGADAVSGVVNFIMKKDFDGIVARVQNGIGSRGAPHDWSGSIVAGKNFADGRGNITAAFQVSHEGRLTPRDFRRFDFGRHVTLQENPDDPFDDPNIPDYVPMTGVRFFDSSREGGIDTNFDFVPDWRPNGLPYEIGTFIPPFYSIDGTGTPRSDYLGDIRARNRRYVANVAANFEVSDALRFFGEVKYAQGRAFSVGQPTFDYGIFIEADNAFIPDSLRPEIEAAGGAWINRDNFDLGLRGEDNRRETWRTVLGFNGDLSDTIRYELSYVYGRSKVRTVSTNDRLDDRFYAAIDAVRDGNGNIVCRSTLNPNDLRDQPALNFFTDPFSYLDKARLSFTPGANSGCTPLNLFGDGVASQAAIDWVMFDSVSRSKMQQHVLSGFISGTIPGVNLWSDDIGFVVGGEWRKEKSRSTPAEESTLGLTFGNQIFPTEGSFTVKEAFAELRVPILENRPLAEVLEFNVAGRLSDYSTVGSTFTWNAAATWAPVRDLRFRGTYARAVRAPNISELFAPQAQTFQFLTDPCDKDELNNGTSNRLANCQALLGPLGYDPTTFDDPNPFTVIGVQRGNPNLTEETAKSWTLGAVLQPRFIPRLSVSLDWYNITIENAINTALATEVAASCVDAPDIDNVFCAAVPRNPATGGIFNFVLQPENVANFKTSGLDFNLNYRLDPADLGLGSNLGMFNIGLTGNYLNRLTFIPAPGAAENDDRGELLAPKWQATLDVTWKLDPITINYGFNYFSRTSRFTNAEIAADPDIAAEEYIYYKSRHTHDLYMAYDVDDRFRFYMGVNNLFDQKPGIGTPSTEIVSTTNYPVSAVGRFFYAGVRVGLGTGADR